MAQSTGNEVRQYTVKKEAEAALYQFKKAMKTVRETYTKPGQADHIIGRMFADKFGNDIDISILFNEFAQGRYDVIVGRMRQADRARAARHAAEAAKKQALIAEMNLLYCGTAE